MWEELENALAWFKSAPNNWIESRKQDLAAAAQWVWEVIQGDFNDDPTTAQVVTGTVISMIPFVDQICDVRDVVANCKKINEDSNNKAYWLALGLTLIGLFPTLGSLAKGGLKILFAYGRKAALKTGTAALQAGKQALDSDYFKLLSPHLDAGIRKFNEFLALPATRKALKALKWDNPYKEFAKAARKLAGEISTAKLTAAFDDVIRTLTSLTDLIKKWGSAAMQTQVGQLLQMVKRMRNQADSKLGEVLAPLKNTVDRIARRLEVEADMNYRAYTNAINPHAFRRPSLADEMAQIDKAKPSWVDEVAKAKHQALEEAPPRPISWPDISENAPRPLNKAFETFKNATPETYPPGTVLYRVVDPGSFDNSYCWMAKAEFDQLNSKADWRRRFAVWANWNGNGEFVTYTVPPGKPLNAWEGVTASQQLPNTEYWLEGGARQIVLDPRSLDKGYLGKRQSTGWGYGDFGKTPELTGLPVLTNNWKE
jgi:hypothetical protein